MTPRAVWLLAAVVASGDGSCLAQLQRVRSESIVVEVDAAATRQLRVALSHLASGDVESAARALEQFELRHADALVEVEPRRVVRGLLASQVVRARRLAAGAPLGSPRAAAQAEAWLADSRLSGDDDGLEQILHRAAAAPQAAPAAELLAERRWSRGDLDIAIAAWSLLDPGIVPEEINPAAALRLTGSPLTAADIAARILLAEAFDGDLLQARTLLDRFRSLHPEAPGELAGRRGVWTELLESELAAIVSNQEGCAANVMAGASATHGESSGEFFLGEIAWKTSLQPLGVIRGWSGGGMLWRSGWPTIRPLVTGPRLFVQDADGLRGLDLGGGGPAWPAATDDDRGVIDGGQEWTRPPLLPVHGEPRWAPSAAAGRLFALVGWPIAFRAATEPRAVETRLQCYDVERQEGRLLWSRAAAEVCPDDAWRFSGPPLATAGAVSIVVRRGAPDVALGVVTLDAATGELRWFQTICGLLLSPPPGVHIATSDMLVTSWGRLLVAGDFGATACLDGDSGEVQWVARDEPAPWTLFPEASQGPVGGRPALCRRGRVHAVEQDDRTLVQRDLWTGATLWRRQVDTPLAQIVGVRGGVVVAAGRQLWGIDFQTGLLLWKFGYEDPAGAIAGDALIAGSTVWASTHEELFGIDLASGAIVHRLPLRAAFGATGGTLVRGPGRLLVVSGDELAAFSIAP